MLLILRSRLSPFTNEENSQTGTLTCTKSQQSPLVRDENLNLSAPKVHALPTDPPCLPLLQNTHPSTSQLSYSCCTAHFPRPQWTDNSLTSELQDFCLQLKSTSLPVLLLQHQQTCSQPMGDLPTSDPFF